MRYFVSTAPWIYLPYFEVHVFKKGFFSPYNSIPFYGFFDLCGQRTRFFYKDYLGSNKIDMLFWSGVHAPGKAKPIHGISQKKPPIASTIPAGLSFVRISLCVV